MSLRARRLQAEANERQSAVVVKGAEALPKFQALLQGFGFPGGLFALPSLEEFGFVEKTGLFWIKQPGRLEHTFPLGKVLVVYHQEVSGRIGKGIMAMVKGLKMKYVENKEMFLARTANRVWVDNPPSGMIHFRCGRSYKPPEETFSVDVFAPGQ